MANLPKQRVRRHRAHTLSARLSTYRRHNGRFVNSVSSSLTLTLPTDAGGPPDRSAPVVVVGCRYPWRHFIADLRELADYIEHGLVDGPADFLAAEDLQLDREPEDAA